MLKLKFEDSFQETEIGNIPSGWDVKQLGSALKIKYGKGLPERDRRSGNIPVFGSSGIVGFHDRALCKGPGLIIGRKGNIGSVYFSKSDFYPIDTVFLL
jgi:type I restriction enzyme S subunit